MDSGVIELVNVQVQFFHIPGPGPKHRGVYQFTSNARSPKFPRHGQDLQKNEPVRVPERGRFSDDGDRNSRWSTFIVGNKNGGVRDLKPLLPLARMLWR